MVAALLIPASLAWYGAWGALGLLTIFMLAIGIAMARGRQPDCHCFGQIHSEPVGWPTLLRNAGLAACAGWLIAGGQRQLGPGLRAWFIALGIQQRKIAVIAVCLLGFLFFRLIDRSRPKSEPLESQPAVPSDDGTPVEQGAPRAQQPVRTRKVVAGIGLPIGTPAPEFELPAISGEKWSLHALREKHQNLMLIFTSPYCEPCQALAPLLVRWVGEMDCLPQVVLISRGTVADNLARLKEFGTLKVLLQQDFEVAEAFDITSTPTAVLVSAEGLIRSDLAMGAIAIKQLFSSCAKAANPAAEDAAHPAGNVPARL
jgi:peroxiredoxin